MPDSKTLSAIKKRVAAMHLPKPRKLSRADIITLVASFIIALLLWTYIAANVMQEYTVQLNKIPLSVDITNSRAASYSLNLTPESLAALEDITVDGTVTGSRSMYGALKSTDVVAYVDFNSTVAAIIGTQTLPIRLRTVSGEELTNFTLSRSSVTVEMDRYETRAFPVNEVSAPFLIRDDETRINESEISYEPSTVQIYGPSRRLAQIDHVRVNIVNSEDLTQTKTFSDCADFTLEDSDGNEVDASSFNVGTTRFSVRIPVFYSGDEPCRATETTISRSRSKRPIPITRQRWMRLKHGRSNRSRFRSFPSLSRSRFRSPCRRASRTAHISNRSISRWTARI